VPGSLGYEGQRDWRMAYRRERSRAIGLLPKSYSASLVNLQDRVT
jgi:hypothetical protein